MPTYFFPWRMLRVSFKDHWRGGFLKGCILVLVEFNVISMYKTKLFYVSADWYGLSFLRGLRKKGQYNYPISKFWFTFFFFCWGGEGQSFGFETCPETTTENHFALFCFITPSLNFTVSLPWHWDSRLPVRRAQAQMNSYCISLLTWYSAEW